MPLVCRCLLICVAVLVGSPAVAQDDVQVRETGEGQPYLSVIEALIDHVGEGRIDDAIGILTNDTTKGVPESARENLKRTLAGIYAGGGRYEGHEVVAVRPISSRLHRVYAVAYHERQPLVYTFTMYLFDGEWKINHVHWDDKVTKLADAVDQDSR